MHPVPCSQAIRVPGTTSYTATTPAYLPLHLHMKLGGEEETRDVVSLVAASKGAGQLVQEVQEDDWASRCHVRLPTSQYY